MKRRIGKIQVIAAVLILAAGGGILIAVNKNTEENTTYRESVVQRGDLVVGITESGSVDVGTVQQVFELDMSALQRAETSDSSGNSSVRVSSTDISSGGSGGNSNAAGSRGGSSMGGSAMGGSSMGGASMGGASMGGFSIGGSSGNSNGGTAGGLDLFGQIFNMAGNSGGSGGESIGNLSVAEVCVSVGQEVKEGDVLYLLEEEGVTELEEELASNVEKAEADLNAVYADQILSKQTAQYTYDSSLAYGDYASTEYSTTLKNLQDAVTDAEKDLETAKNLLTSYQEQLAQAKADCEDAKTVLKNCQWSLDNTDKWDNTWHYVMYFDMVETAQRNVDSLEQKTEQFEKNVEQAEENVDTYTRNLNAAKRNLASGKLSAQETRSLRQLAYDTAQETYDIAMGYLEDGAKEQEETYADAKSNWEKFSTHIDGNAVKANYNGVITEVNLAVGDTLSTNDALVTLYDMDAVSMTVSVDEEDMTDIELGTLANVSFTAYPDDIYKAEVTEISDAETDNNGTVTYEVTVTMKGDASGLYQGMTGDITFVTKETKEVIYISNRAVIREGTKSYVKIKDENGNIRKQEIVTGFSDGINVEIVEGLSEGDVILIESKVNEA